MFHLDLNLDLIPEYTYLLTVYKDGLACILGQRYKGGYLFAQEIAESIAKPPPQ